MATNVLVIGSGGREHALVWKLSQSPKVGKLYVAPGNGGTSQLAENVPIKATELRQLVEFAEQKSIDLTVVGPDDPLALGIVDLFRKQGLRIFGPTEDAALIEASKIFAKWLMTREHVPTAVYKKWPDYGLALAYLHQRGMPIVIKANGLALGKGVYVCQTLAEAEDALADCMLKRVHGAAGEQVIIEEYLGGPEISIHAFCDGKTSVLFPTAQDHKPIGEGDTGRNTGGMGTIAPVPGFTQASMEKIQQTIVQPILTGLARLGRTFVGCLYPGLKITPEGPKVLEFNARFGDPETQSYMRLLRTDLLDIFEACVDGRLADLTIEWSDHFAACIVLASEGYPGNYRKGELICGVGLAEKLPEVVVFHAGTILDGSRLRTSGGRVLGVTATGTTLQKALDQAYAAVDWIDFEGMQYRRDIGAKALAMESAAL
jgi:phosphoribosylamine--glycine ligase